MNIIKTPADAAAAAAAITYRTLERHLEPAVFLMVNTNSVMGSDWPEIPGRRMVSHGTPPPTHLLAHPANLQSKILVRV